MPDLDPGDLFVCPLTRKRLRRATSAELTAMHKRPGLESIRDAWIRSDRAIAYPVEDGIPCLVPEAAISLRKTRPSATSR